MKNFSQDKTYLLNLIAGGGDFPTLMKFGTATATITGEFAAIIVDEDGTTFSAIEDPDGDVGLTAKGLNNAMNKGALITAGANNHIATATITAGQALAYPKPSLEN